MLDPFAELTPVEEDAIDGINISPELLERARRDDAAWGKEKAERQPSPPEKHKDQSNGRQPQ